MARVVLVGSDVALLEGLAQSLSAFGHEVSVAATIAGIGDIDMSDAPELAVVSCDELAVAGAATAIPLVPGGALVVYGTCADERPYLHAKLQRSTLAHLVLPLERHRLIALVQSFEARARVTGRSRPEETEQRSELQD